MKRSAPLVPVLLATALLLLQLVMELLGASLDLTADRRHSLSRATTDIIEGLDHPITVTYYVSDELLNRYPEPARISDLLRSYERAGSAVRVRVDSVDSARVDALRLPLAPQQISESEGDEQRVLTVYSGIVVEYLDRQESIPFVFDSRDLEYRLTTLVRRVAQDSLPVIGILSADPAPFDDSTLFLGELQALFDLVALRPGEPIAPMIAAVVAPDAHRLGEGALDELAHYARGGGSVLVMAEAATVALDGTLSVRAENLETLNGTLEEFGVRVGGELLLDPSSNSLPVQVPGESSPVNQLVPYPLWPAITARTVSESHSLTTQFPGLDLYWAAPVRPLLGHPAVPRPLVSSSSSAWLMTGALSADPNESVLENPDPRTIGQYPVVTQSDAGASGRIIVVGDSDLPRDVLIDATASYYNVDFLVRVVQYLANEGALLDLRSRSVRDLSLSGVEDPLAERALQRFAVVMSTFVVPTSALIIGGVIVFTRSRRRRAS